MFVHFLFQSVDRYSILFTVKDKSNNIVSIQFSQISDKIVICKMFIINTPVTMFLMQVYAGLNSTGSNCHKTLLLALSYYQSDVELTSFLPIINCPEKYCQLKYPFLIKNY